MKDLPERVVYTEEAEAELWEMLSKYAYHENIRRHMEKNGHTDPEPEVLEAIASAFSQGAEYCLAVRSATLHTAPLLLYYGCTSLLQGTSILAAGKVPMIRAHGIEVLVPEENNTLGSVKLWFRGGEQSAFRFYNEPLFPHCFVPYGAEWTLSEILGSIPDIYSDFLTYFPGSAPSLLPIEAVTLDDDRFDRMRRSVMELFDDEAEVLGRIAGAKQAYLPPHRTNGYYILRPRLTYEPVSVSALSGQRFLQLQNNKNGRLVALAVAQYHFIALRVLGFLARYAPQLWGPFVRSDATGERNLVERFVRISRRSFPNMVLNIIQGETIRFLSPGAMLDSPNGNSG